MNVYRSGDYSNRHPEWYWSRGLHDARIISSEFLEFGFDYKSKNPVLNSLTLKIDATSAMYDSSVRKLTFYNCTFMTPDIKIDGCFWLQDELTYENDRFNLSITVTDCANEYVFTIGFQYAEVVRG